MCRLINVGGLLITTDIWNRFRGDWSVLINNFGYFKLQVFIDCRHSLIRCQLPIFIEEGGKKSIMWCPEISENRVICEKSFTNKGQISQCILASVLCIQENTIALSEDFGQQVTCVFSWPAAFQWRGIHYKISHVRFFKMCKLFHAKDYL